VRALAVLSLVVACGGKTATSPKTEDQREKDLAEAKAFADRACACADAKCAEALDTELKVEFQKMSVWKLGEMESSDLSEEQQARLTADLVRLFQCIHKTGTPVYSLGVVAKLQYESIKVAACECTDTACVRKTVAAWEEANGTVGKFPIDDETERELSKIAAEATACFKTGGEMLLEEAVLELKAIRKASCACVDPECAEAARAELDAWGVRHERTPADETTQEQLVEIVSEAATCQVRASSEAARQGIVDLTVLRDAACACTTPACADEVQAGFDVFLETYADVHGTPEASNRIGELAGEMHACLVSARGE
jgi:hypothetical protein